MKLIEQKRKALEKQIADAKSLYTEMESDEAKRTTDNRETYHKIIEDGKAVRQEIESIE